MDSERRAIALDAEEHAEAQRQMRRWLGARERAARRASGLEVTCELQPAVSVAFVREITAAVDEAVRNAPRWYRERSFPSFVVSAVPSPTPGELARIEARDDLPALIYVFPAALRRWEAGADADLLPDLPRPLLRKVLAHEIGHDLYSLVVDQAGEADWLAVSGWHAGAPGPGEVASWGRPGYARPVRTGALETLLDRDPDEGFANAAVYLLLAPDQLAEIDPAIARYMAELRKSWRVGG